MDVALPEDREAARDRRSKLHEVLAAGTLIVDARVGGVKDGLLDAEERELPRTVDDGNMWLGEDVVRFRVRSAEAAGADARDAQWHERLRFAVEVSEDGEARRWLIVDKWRHDAATEEDRSAGRPQLLDEHQSWAECRARSLAKALQLDDYAELLAVAARLHDEGKRASRWQRAFNAPTNGV
jgi:CRISPR-associated endonuclease/helicase Cas3